MQRWCRPRTGKASHQQTAQAKRQQAHINSGQEYWRGTKLASDWHIIKIKTNNTQVTSGLLPDGRFFASKARDMAADWRSTYKSPIPTHALADRMGSYVQAYTLYSSVRPFGITGIIAGWDSEAEVPVDGQVGTGPKVGAGGKKEGGKHGGPFLYMIEPSGLYWVCLTGIL